MKAVVHLEPEEFARELCHNKNHVYARTYVLDCGVAIVVYFCQGKDYLYYLDRVDCSPLKRDKVDQIDFYDLHAEVYRKVNLDERLRNRA